MERPIVSISDGKVQGIVRESILGKKYLAFTGIPYAQPPLGPLRFKEPQPPVKWSGLFDASKRRDDLATQYQTGGPRPWPVIGDEDCLYLNVYANAIGRKRPVMFYIHGGGFVEGSGNHWIYGEDYFVTMDMVLVCVNFRLGPLGKMRTADCVLITGKITRDEKINRGKIFDDVERYVVFLGVAHHECNQLTFTKSTQGFLNLGHEVAPGNQGLRDILFALKWVQRNIEAFGGDPDNVTIFGNSSGSMICHLFTLIPAARGLFHKAILQSGLSFLARSLLKGSEYKNGYKIAKFLGCDSKDPIEIIEFLRTVPVKKLVSVEKHLSTKWESVILGQFNYVPVIDGSFCKDPIVPVPLGQLLTNDANIPIIIGHTTNECLLGFAGMFDDLEHFAFYDDHIDDILKNSLMFENSSETSKIIADMKKFYLKGQPITPDTVWNLINLLSHMFINMNRKVVDLRNEHAKAPTYVYQFSHCGDEPTFYSYDEGPQPHKGVAHADELSYMFNISYMKMDGTFPKCPKEGSVDRLVIERFIRMWFNFASTGNPTPKTDDRYITTIWKPSSKEHLYYLDIGEDLILKDDRKSEDWQLYEKIRKNYLGLSS